MKNLLILIYSLLSVYGFSQSTMPVFKKGTKLSYEIATNEGTMLLNMSLDSITPSYIKYKWSASNVGTGIWEVKEKSLQSANSGRWSQLEPDTDIILPDDQSVGLLSKDQWTSIQQNKILVLDMVSYSLKKSPEQFKLNNAVMDVIYLESQNGGSKIWVLNNPSFPVILKLTGNSAGPDVELKKVE